MRTNLTDDDPARLWGLYLQLVSVEEAFKNLKSLPPRRRGVTSPSGRSFTKTKRVSRRISSSPSSPTACTSRSPAASTPWHQASRRAAWKKFAAVQMIDLHVPTTDGRELLLTRYTEPEPELALLLDKLKFVLPAQPEPKISAAQIAPSSPA